MKAALLLLAIVACCSAADDEWSWRIIGGQNAGDSYPYQVSLRSPTNVHFCGGSIISAKTILTAAHCLTGKTASNTLVHVGSSQLNSGGTKYTASKLISHSSYSSSSKANDVALVIISNSIALGAGVQIIPLGTGSIGDGVTVTLTGWGAVSYPGGAVPNNLQMINLKTIGVTDCRTRLTGIGSVFDTSLCTLTKSGEGACTGDSGGPLVSGGSIVGIVSWGSPCANGYPDVFARVSSYVTWINSNKV